MMSVAEYFAEFEKIADEKLDSRREKYGELVPIPANYEYLCDHMLEEIAEWIHAEYGPDDIINAVAVLISKLTDVSNKYSMNDAEENLIEELADIYNMARIMYMCKIDQGDI